MCDLWIDTSVVPRYFRAVEEPEEEVSANLLSQLSPIDEIKACLGVLKQVGQDKAKREILSKRFCMQARLMTCSDV